ncbi:Tyrosine recombinase xerD [Fibrisoma limi BUZ 3]|uniref:Tyrosine recombinase xerD n=1 Tax=Fibrisoma limi BUZ 3 TaxID=1185876 RepID=I2GKU7_9BACT|nr:site-specific integrase [Fibrisoma limi]CCH54523.1 Tyrosine recombinase xerD [Fibrisoma limi BUZ 3]
MGSTTLKVVLEPDANEAGLHKIRLRVTRDRKPRYFGLSIWVTAKQFNPNGDDQKANWVRGSHPDQGAYNQRIRDTFKRAEKIIGELEKSGDFTSDHVISQLKHGGKPDLLLEYYAAHIDQRRKLAGNSLQKHRTCGLYERALAILTEFLTSTKRTKLPVSGLTKALVLEYRAWLESRYAVNTVSNNLTCLRKVVREAMDDELIAHTKYPFKGVTISVKRKIVSRLREDDIDKLATAERSPSKKPARVVTPREHARPMALLMYYMQGIRLADLVQLRRSNYVVEDGEHRIKYLSGKAQKERNVLLPDEAISLLQPYLNRPDGTLKKPGDVLFPYLLVNIDKLNPQQQIKEIARATSRLYHQIKTLGTAIGLGKKITPHVMRHSFADLLRRKHVDLITIQMTLGHSDPRTTRDYMESLDQAAVDSVVQHFKRESQENNRKTTMEDGAGEGVADEIRDGDDNADLQVDDRQSVVNA